MTQGGVHALTARWDGTSWTNVKSRSPGHANGTTLFAISMASASSGFAVGYFMRSDGFDRPFIEQWNGARWLRQQVD